MDTERALQTRGVAFTANLAVRKDVFERVGVFSESFKSGGDVEFTSRMTGAGLVGAFVPEMKVSHPARGFFELVAKTYRVGSGKRFGVRGKKITSILQRNQIKILLPGGIGELEAKKQITLSAAKKCSYIYVRLFFL